MDKRENGWYNRGMKYLFFDLDGTLTDPYEGITKSALYAIDYFGYPRPEERVLRTCIGPPLYAWFQSVFGMTQEQSVQAVEKFRERYHAVGWKENALLPGVKEGLFALKRAGKILAVATGKPTPFAEKILQLFGVAECFSIVVGSELDGSRITKEEELSCAMQAVGATKEESVMIGDRKYDVEGARAVGIKAIGAEIGYAEKGELESAGADVIFSDFPSLVQYLLKDECGKQ